jgi:beta-galactosidase
MFGWLGLMAVGNAAQPAQLVQLLDDNWRFQSGEVRQAEAPSCDDNAWRTVTLPHDWSIEGSFAATNASSWGGGYLPSGVGWYRKTFSLGESVSGRRVFIEFDGVMANSDVWINGHHLGHRPNGYVSFRYDLTPYLGFVPVEGSGCRYWS